MVREGVAMAMGDIGGKGIGGGGLGGCGRGGRDGTIAGPGKSGHCHKQKCASRQLHHGSDLLVRSRGICHRLLIAGANAGAFRAAIENGLGRGQKLLDVRDGRPELRSAIDRYGRASYADFWEAMADRPGGWMAPTWLG